MATAVANVKTKFRIDSVHLGEIKVVVPTVFADERGFFMESFRADEFQQLGLPHNFVQDNHSKSAHGVLRGLHFQYDPPMGKLMRVGVGRAWLVAVDMRKNSPTFKQWWGTEVSAENKIQIWAPAGFARGFCVLSESAELLYKCTGVYSQKTDVSVRWDDPDIGIRWPLPNPQISERDRNALSLKQWIARPESDLVK